MRKMSLKIIPFLIMLLTGCNSMYQPVSNSQTQLISKTTSDIRASAKSFEGQHKSVILKAWGPAKSISSDGLGGEIYHYSQSTNITSGTFVIYINMYVNKDGVVYRSDVKSNLI